MSDLRDLYQEVILDHSKKPRNFRLLAEASHQAEGFNPLCGDRVTVFLRMEGERVAEVSFQGSGCAISTASASLMTEVLKGRTATEARVVFDRFHDLVTGRLPAANPGTLGKLAAFSGVGEFPLRVKCATLAWHTFRAALERRQDPVSTE